MTVMHVSGGNKHALMDALITFDIDIVIEAC